MQFKDLFSTQAKDYARFRPLYPESLYAYLASAAPSRECVWDVGTGNGQAAVGLAHYFSRVEATDPSEAQLASALKHPKIHFHVASAEASGLEPQSADLITVAQAFHWFQQAEFFRETKRVAKPGAILALWTYAVAEVSPEVDAVVERLYSGILGAYWEKERRLVDEGYRHEKIPFAELAPPAFAMQADWSLEQMLGYLGTWSALQKYRRERGTDPLDDLGPDFARAWGAGIRKVTWPLGLRVFAL